MNQWRWRMEWSPSLSVISAAVMAFGKSCLLAKTRSTASRSSSSFSIRWSSSLASETRSRSLLSTTKISPLSVLEIVSPKRTDLFEIIVSLVSTPWFTQRKNRTPDVIAFVYYLILPPTSHTVKEIFLYSTVSTLNPGRSELAQR